MIEPMPPRPEQRTPGSADAMGRDPIMAKAVSAMAALPAGTRSSPVATAAWAGAAAFGYGSSEQS